MYHVHLPRPRASKIDAHYTKAVDGLTMTIRQRRAAGITAYEGIRSTLIYNGAMNMELSTTKFSRH